ncbi:hypothetical protein RIF29_26503 [Crotalaria pallida]|uniref:Uncharacterized protein n=1 Tax=Crotalaria pallida TaxID=3830 RepID=A0AAN9EQ26_CROPI
MHDGGDSQNMASKYFGGEENKIAETAPIITVATINVEDKDEALHGDWLVVRRKKGGIEKRNGILAEKKKEIGTQSLPNEGNKESRIVLNKRVNGGSPHLLNFPHTVSSLTGDTTRGKGLDNGKKRARKEMPQLTTTKGNASHKIAHGKEKPTQINESHNANGSGGKVINKKANPLLGFELGPGISISPNLGRGMPSTKNHDNGLNGKPPDNKKDQSGSTALKGDESVHTEGVGDELNGSVLKEESGMMLDSGQ